MSSLPKYVALKTMYKYNDKFLRYVSEEGPLQGFLQFSGDDVFSPSAKFQVEWAKSGEKLVHLRCCYNNKYWVTISELDLGIVCKSDKPEEDKSKWWCTLFELTHLEGANFQFKHVSSGNCVQYYETDPVKIRYECFTAISSFPAYELSDVCTVTDWDSLVVLPKLVVFKGDNDKYLQPRVYNGQPFLQFQAKDPADLTLVHQVFRTPDGSIRLKSNLVGKFWRRSPNWVWADSTDSTTEDKDTLFLPIKVGDKVVALRNLGNNKFCNRLTLDGKTDCLNAGVLAMSRDARLEVSEPILSRKIYDCDYHVADARVYDEQVILVGIGGAANNTNDIANLEVKVSVTQTKTTSWNHGVSLKLGLETSFTTKVPFIADGEIKFTIEGTYSYQWGTIDTVTSTFEALYKVAVQPMTEATVSAIATTGTCNIPFSYSTTDTLIDGRRVTSRMDDGMYTGMNTYKLHFETKVRKLNLAPLGS